MRNIKRVFYADLGYGILREILPGIDRDLNNVIVYQGGFLVLKNILAIMYDEAGK